MMWTSRHKLSLGLVGDMIWYMTKASHVKPARLGGFVLSVKTSCNIFGLGILYGKQCIEKENHRRKKQNTCQSHDIWCNSDGNIKRWAERSTGAPMFLPTWRTWGSSTMLHWSYWQKPMCANEKLVVFAGTKKKRFPDFQRKLLSDYEST